MSAHGRSLSAIAWRTVLPALIFIVGLDVLYLAGGWPIQAFIQVNASLWAVLMVLFPVLALLRGRCSLHALGFRKSLSGWMYLWGVLVGICWRLIDLLIAGTWLPFGQAWNGGPPGDVTWIATLNALLIAPLIEETFFRGFLQAGLQERIGERWAIPVQALLFALHPIHLFQSRSHLVLFFLFGLVAGVMVRRTRSLYPLLCAHGIVNILPEALYAAGEWWWATNWVLG